MCCTLFFLISISLIAIKVNDCIGTVGLLGTSSPWDFENLLGTMKDNIKVGRTSARGAFSMRTSFLHISPLWPSIFYNISIPHEKKFNFDSNCYSSF